MSQPCIHYLRTDARLTFRKHIECASRNVATFNVALSRITLLDVGIPNTFSYVLGMVLRSGNLQIFTKDAVLQEEI